MIKRAVIALFILLLVATAAPARELQGVDMPESLKVAGQTVALNGVGLRKVLFIKPYVGGLYLTAAQTDGNKIMSADEPMAIRLHMIDDVGQKMMLRSLYNGMRSSVKATGGDFTKLEERIEQLKSYFHDEISEGDIFQFENHPGKGVTVIKNQQARGTIPGMDFKQAFFGIWLNSESPADSDLRVAMLAGDVRVAVVDEKAAADAKKAADEAAAKQKAEMVAQAQQAAAEKAKAEAEMIGAKAKAKAEAKATEEKAKEEAATKAADAQAGVEAEKKAVEEKADTEMKSAEKAVEPPKAAEEAPAPVVAPPAEEKAAPAAPPVAEKAPAKVEPAAPAIITAQEFESQDVYFASSKTTLGPIGRKNVDGKIAWLKANPTAKVVVEIQADSLGQNEQRADSIISYMKAAGIESSRMEKKVSGEVSSTGPASRTAHLRLVQ